MPDYRHSRLIAHDYQNSSKIEDTREGNESNQTITISQTIQSAPQIDLLSDTHPRLPTPHSTKPLCSEALSGSSPNRQGWQTFGDDNNVMFGDDNNATFEDDNNPMFDLEDNDSDDDFSKLAENRIQKQSCPTFSTDLRQEDLDDSVQDYLDGTKCLEAFSRTRSVEDLLNI